MARRKLSDEERQARKRMRLVSPENAGKVVSVDIFWTVSFLQLYFERCDAVAFEDPQSAHRLAYHAPTLADLVEVGDRPGEYNSPEQKRSFRVHALAVYAGICRRVGKNSEALNQYRRAFELLREGNVHPRAEAELMARYGVFKSIGGDPESLELFDRAMHLFARVGDPPGQAQTLVLRGAWYYHQGDRPRAGIDWAKALAEGTKHPKNPRSERAITAAIGNLARLLAEGSVPLAGCSQCVALVEMARRRFSRSRTSDLKMKILWIEGSLNRALQFVPHALRLLGRAREGFRALDLPGEFALVSLEIAVLLWDEGDREGLTEIREDTISTMQGMAADPLFLKMASRWTVESRKDGLREIEQAIRALGY